MMTVGRLVLVGWMATATSCSDEPRLQSVRLINVDATALTVDARTSNGEAAFRTVLDPGEVAVWHFRIVTGEAHVILTRSGPGSQPTTIEAGYLEPHIEEQLDMVLKRDAVAFLPR